MRWHRIVSVAVALIGLSVAAPHVRAAEFKMGYVDMGVLFDGYERTKQSEGVLERKGQQKESELQGRLDELKKMRQGLDLLNEQAREARARELERKADELRRFGNNTKEDLLKERNALAEEIIKDMQLSIQVYAKANGFTFILDERSLLFGQDAHNITQDVLKYLNQRYAAKSGAKASTR
jgi:outer membrane protein